MCKENVTPCLTTSLPLLPINILTSRSKGPTRPAPPLHACASRHAGMLMCASVLAPLPPVINPNDWQCPPLPSSPFLPLLTLLSAGCQRDFLVAVNSGTLSRWTVALLSCTSRLIWDTVSGREVNWLSVCGRIPNSLFERSKTGLAGGLKGEDRMFYRSLEGFGVIGEIFVFFSPKKSLTVLKKSKTLIMFMCIQMPSGIKLKKKKRNGNKIVPDSTGSCFPSVFKRGNLWPKCGKRLTNYKKVIIITQKK